VAYPMDKARDRFINGGPLGQSQPQDRNLFTHFLVGENEVEFSVHGMIAHQYCNDLDNMYHAPDRIRLPNTDPEWFVMFVKWMYSGTRLSYRDLTSTPQNPHGANAASSAWEAYSALYETGLLLGCEQVYKQPFRRFDSDRELFEAGPRPFPQCLWYDLKWVDRRADLRYVGRRNDEEDDEEYIEKDGEDVSEEDSHGTSEEDSKWDSEYESDRNSQESNKAASEGDSQASEEGEQNPGGVNGHQTKAFELWAKHMTMADYDSMAAHFLKQFPKERRNTGAYTRAMAHEEKLQTRLLDLKLRFRDEARARARARREDDDAQMDG
jgi:hypothetical protein